MRHVLRRHEIDEARRLRGVCEAIYAGTAPGLINDTGLRHYHDFLGRMNTIISPPQHDLPAGVSLAEVRAFDAIAARAKVSRAQTAAPTGR